ncbi:MAG: hypothetical protein N2322_04710, partial [Terrimicrobiaceae bacterium]|nr:hypothetical protein [Terrimicrobiaceae bacterium]
MIFGEGKSPEELAAIALEMDRHGLPVLATRIGPDHFAAVRKVLPAAVHHPRERCLLHGRWKALGRAAPVVAVVCAGTSDLPVASEARLTLEFLGHRALMIPDVGVAG